MPYDVIVVGAGIHGAASAYRLARAGKRVLILEQFDALHFRGSSHGETRVIRSAYEHPAYVRLVHRAFEGWRELEREANLALLEPRPHLDLAAPDHPGFAAVQRALRAEGVPHEELDAAQLRARFPALRVPEGHAALLDRRAGLVQATASVRTLLRLAERRGAELRALSRVRTLEAASHGWRVGTDEGTWEAGQVVLAVGAWTNALLRPLGVEFPLQVSRTQAGLYPPVSAAWLDALPIFYDHATSVYGIPERVGGVVKIGNRHREPVDPDARSFAPIPENLSVLGDWIAARLEGVSAAPREVVSCLYTFTPDEDFIVDRVPGPAGLVAVSACSGHGFKFAPVLGELVADLVDGGAAPEAFAFARFRTPGTVSA